jgi:hypothetical protein
MQYRSRLGVSRPGAGSGNPAHRSPGSAEDAGRPVGYGYVVVEEWLSRGVLLSGAAGDSGGGIDNFQGLMTLTNTTISGNSADANGGGIVNFASLQRLAEDASP